MKLSDLLYTGIFLLCACTGNDTYYIDSISGNDMNSGLSENKAWKSLSRIQDITLSPGDKVLLKNGSSFWGELDITAEGTEDNPVVIGSYGEKDDNPPCIIGNDQSLYAVRISNSDYLTLQDIDIVNTGKEPLAGRTGLKIECIDHGTSHNIRINNVTVRDVNGSLVKEEGGGSGILIENGGDSILSRFENLTIENCHILRCSRNGIIWNGYYDRRKWYPSKHTVIRNNLIEQVPGDGIVPIGCDSTLIEYNIMRDCPDILSMTEAAAGIWPWSCDNTIIQFNEVSGHKAPWDAQGFDSDYNCNNTIIQYNYSHDNYGGLALICNNGIDKDYNCGNNGTILRYNISIGDGIRPKETRAGMFSPGLHIAGSVKNSLIEKNIIHLNRKASPEIDNAMIVSDSWGGFADSTSFRNNIFYSHDRSYISMTRSENNLWDNNCFIGRYDSIQSNSHNKAILEFYNANVLEKDREGYGFYHTLMNEHKLKGISGNIIDKEKIESFWSSILDL